MKKVYVVVIDWSIAYDSGIEIFVFGTYEKSRKKYEEFISDELNPDNSWVGKL